MAAVLACGDGAVLSHRDAAALWGIRASAASRIDVTVPSWAAARAEAGPGSTESACRRRDTTIRDGIPVTTVPRTPRPRRCRSPRCVEEGDQEAEVAPVRFGRGEPDAPRNTRRPGCRALRTALATYEEPAFTRSDLEDLMLALPRTAPAAEAARQHDGRRLRGRLPMARAGADRRDRRPPGPSHSPCVRGGSGLDVRLTVLGYRVLRFTHRQLAYESERVAPRSAPPPVPVGVAHERDPRPLGAAAGPVGRLLRLDAVVR